MPRVYLENLIPDFQRAFIAKFGDGYKVGVEDRLGYPQPLDVSVSTPTKSIELRPVGCAPSPVEVVAQQIDYKAVPVDAQMELWIYQPEIPDADMMLEASRVIPFIRARVATPDTLRGSEAWGWAIHELDKETHGALVASVFSFSHPALSVSDDYIDELAAPRILARYIFINGRQSAP